VALKFRKLMARLRVSAPVRFGPFRHVAHPGIPADRFMPFGDAVRCLVANGPDIQAPPVDDARRQELRTRVAARLGFADISAAGEALIVQIDAAVDELMDELGIDDPNDDDASAAVIAERLEADSAVEALRAEMGLHEPHSGPHSHSHSHGTGDDKITHSHQHFHANSAVHNHGHPEQSKFAGMTEAQRREADAANEVTGDALDALVASLLAEYPEERRQALTAATNANGEVVGAAWHAYACVEGIRTDDGRELLPGSTRYPDMPISLRLLVEDEGAHWGAVSCGRADSCKPMEAQGLSFTYAEGVFGSDPNGQLAELMVEEQTQRFISIDPRDVTAERVEVEIRRNDIGDVYDIDGDQKQPC